MKINHLKRLVLLTHIYRLVQKRKEATAAISLMQAQYERIFSDEEAKNGLLIVHAFYGKFADEDGELK